MTGTPSRTARVPTARWDLKEAAGKIPTRGTRSAYEASPRGQGSVGFQNPMSSGTGIGAYMRRVWEEGHAPYPGRSAILPQASLSARGDDGMAEVSRGHIKAVASAKGPNE